MTPKAEVIPGIRFTDGVITEIVLKNFPTIPKEHIYSRFRGRDCVTARDLIMTFTHIINPKSLQCTGLPFGRDHATVLHGFKTTANLYDTCKEMRTLIDNLRKELLVDEESWSKWYKQASKFRSFSKVAFTQVA